MAKVEKGHITHEKKPIFIDYTKIPGSPQKRLEFLKALIQMINTRKDYASYKELGLDDTDKELFKSYLYENYYDNFDTRKRKNDINLYENYDGKIICGVDLLIDDLFDILSKIKISPNIEDLKHKPKTEIESIKHDKIFEPTQQINLPKDKEIFDLIYEWIFLGLDDSKSINDELSSHLHDICSFDESKIKEYFNIDRIIICINRYFSPIELRMFNKRITQTRGKLLLLLDGIEKKLPDKVYWSELIEKTKEIFKFYIEIHPIVINKKCKLFLTMSGNPEISNTNPIISKYHNKVVLFNKSSLLYKKIELNQIILAEIIMEKETFYLINPERIIDKSEVKKWILFGVDACPSKDIVLNFINVV